MAKRPTNVVVTLKPGESQERLLRRFLKKVKKSEIIREYLDKTSFFKTKRQKARDRMLRNKFIRKKSQQKRVKKGN